MTNDQLTTIEHTLQQLVAGQLELRDTFGKRLDRVDTRLDGMDRRLDGIDTRLDGIDRRLDHVDHRLDTLEDKFQLLADAQAIAQEQMARGFKEIREELNDRLVPIETAVRRLSGAAPARSRRSAAGPQRKRTSRR